MEDSSEQHKPKMKRLKKMRHSSDEEELARGASEEKNDEWKVD